MKLIFFKVLILTPLITYVNLLQSQNISGRVNDSFHTSIPEVEIILNNNVISKTNKQGVFTLPEGSQLPIQITLKHPHYDVKTVTLSKNHSIFQLSVLKETLDLDEVTIASTYQKESRVIVPTVKVSSEKFDIYSPVDLISAINETPGVFIQSGALNTNRIVIRGVGSRTPYGTNKIRAYFNGIPITNGIGETTIDAFDPEDISNLEIVKGPKATQYGTNLGGTLLLNSKQALEGETYVKSHLTVGSFGLIKNNVSIATANEKLAINLNYDLLRLDGFRDNNKYNRKAVLLTSNYKFNSKNNIGILINYTDYFAEIPSSIGETAFNESPSQAAFTWNAAQGFEDNKQVLVGLNYTHRFSNNFSNTTSIFYNYLDHYEPRPFNILDEYTKGYGVRTLFAKDFKFLFQTAHLSFGGELYSDQYHWKTIENRYENNNNQGSLEGELLSDNQEHRNNLNGFATLTLPLTKKLKAQLGFNINSTNYSFRDQFNVGENNKNADRNFDPIVAPNLNILYQLAPQLNAYINISRGFNYPSIEETLTPEGIINPDLGPETGVNYEIGSTLFLFQRKMRLQLTAYLLDIDNLLVADRIGEDQYIGRNAGKTEHKGLELSASFIQTLSNGLSVSPYFNAEVTDHRFIDFVDNETNYSGHQLTGVPKVKINGGLQFCFKNVKLNTNVLHVGEMPLNDANTLSSKAYTVFNTKLSFKSALTSKFNIEINLGINNFTDEKYASSVLINAVGFGNSEPRYYYPGMPRNWFSGIKIAYRI